MHHVSSVDPAHFERLLSLALEYIWLHLHCATIKVSIYHYEVEGRLQVNTEIKNLLKAKGFKWKTVTNEVKSGQRIEIMECPNTQHKPQMDAQACTIYREGLKREDIHKEPFAFKVSCVSVIGA